MTELQEVGKALVKLSAEQIARMDLPEALRDAVLDCKKFTKHEAVRRQMQYIGRLMRDVDPAPILDKLNALESPSRQQTAFLHLAEQWRDDMLRDPAAVDRFEREFPHADAHRLRALLAAAGEERKAKRAPKHFRELFHAINSAIQEQARHS